jgi:hypothetical protein
MDEGKRERYDVLAQVYRRAAACWVARGWAQRTGRLGIKLGESPSHLYYFTPAELLSTTTRVTSLSGVTLVCIASLLVRASDLLPLGHLGAPWSSWQANSVEAREWGCVPHRGCYPACLSWCWPRASLGHACVVNLADSVELTWRNETEVRQALHVTLLLSHPPRAVSIALLDVPRSRSTLILRRTSPRGTDLASRPHHSLEP